MQQVSVRSTAAQIAIDPRRLPVRARTKRNWAVVAVNQIWVLHRRTWVQLGVGMVLVALLAGAFQARGGIMQGIDLMAATVSGELANGGFGVAAIEISGQSITTERTILSVLGLDNKQSILNFDVDEARERLLALPAIETASVRKTYPNHVSVALTEKVPVARWRIDGETMLIDARGTPLGAAVGEGDARLPLVIGSGAANDAQVLIRAMQAHPLISDAVVALSRIADRRWDLIYETGLRVQLPETGLASALSRLESYQRDHKILDRDLSLIDLRVDGVVSVRVVNRDDETPS